MSKARKGAIKNRNRLDLNPLHIIPILIVIAFLFRLFLAQYRFAVAFDEVNYLKLGVSAGLNGFTDVLHTYWSPFLPFLIAISSALFSDYEFAGRIVSIVAGTLVIIPVYLLGKIVYDKNVGILAAAFVALYPPLAFQSTQILTEPLLMLFGALTILFGLYMLKYYSVGFGVLAGLTSGFLYLIHPQGFGFFLVLGFWLLFATLTKLFLIKPLRMLWIGIPFAATFVIVILPYLFYLKGQTGVWTLSAKGAANQQFEAFVPDSDEDPFRAWNPETKSVLIDLIYHQGTFLHSAKGGDEPVADVRMGAFTKKYVKNVYTMLKTNIPQLFTTIPLLLFGAGLFGTTWRNQQGKMILYLMSFIGFFWFGVIPSFHITERYLTPMLPICALWIAHGGVVLYAWLTYYMPNARFSRRIKIKPTIIPAIAILSVFLLMSFLPALARVISRDPDSRDFWADPVEQKYAGKWLKQNASDAGIIMSRNHAVDIYAGNYNIKESVTLPTSDLDGVLAYAKHRRVNYIVLNERYLESYPKMSLLFEPVNEPALSLVYDETDASGLATRIFQVNYSQN